MNIEEAQRDMRLAYTAGSTGAFASGLIWISSGIVALLSTQIAAMSTLFFGGMLIYPLGLLFDKAMHRSGKHQSNNPLAKWAALSTFMIFIGLFIAYYSYQIEASYFFPIMMITIGLRYSTFQYFYGMKIYWTFAATLVASGVLSLILIHQFYVAALLGGIIEIGFSYLIYQQSKDHG